MSVAARRILFAAILLLLLPLKSLAHEPCPRPAAGSAVTPPPDLWSENGELNLTLNYFTTVDSDGRTLFCFMTADGQQGPTLHVLPGDTLNISVTNLVPAPPPGSPAETLSNTSNRCGDATMTITSLNMHFHGTNTPPACHSDEAIHTLINSGESFQYSVHFPSDEPPGLYWYHPHVHGLAEAAVQGGASGAIIVGGITQFQPAVIGLRQRLLIVRDQNVAGNPTPGGLVPSWDLTLNYVPIPYMATPQPGYVPSLIRMEPGEKEFWRVLNASADTILDLELLYDHIAQRLKIVGLDGVPVNSQDGTRRGHTLTQKHILIPPAGRAEFIVTAPSRKVKDAVFQTRTINTGPDGDNDPARPLAIIRTDEDLEATADSQPSALPVAEDVTDHIPGDRFAGLADARPDNHRKLYFSEVLSDPNNPLSQTNFFITVDGATPTLFSAGNPPAITTKQGSVEDWTIENRTGENHEFHIHQIHFLLLAVNGVPVSAEQRQYYDMYQVPYWKGSGPYPSITVRMDFRGPDVGDFVYHCHLLGHEDNGMMATIRVLP